MVIPFRRSWPAIPVIILAGMLLYANTLQVPFYLDDERHIIENRQIRLVSLTPDALRRAALESPLPERPLANVSFALNYYFHRLWLPGYHMVNIAVHLAAAVFLFLFVRLTLQTPALRYQSGPALFIALAAALFWLAHPIQTQTVTYIVQRMNGLAAMLYVLSCWCYAKARFSRPGRRARFWFGGCLASGLLAPAGKEIAVTLPGMLLLYEWYFFQDLRRDWLERRLPFILMAVLLMAGLAFFYLGESPLDAVTAGYHRREFTPVMRLLTEPRVVVLYLALLLLPLPGRLNLEHTMVPSEGLLTPPATLVAGLLLAGLLWAAIRSARRRRLFSFAVLWFLGNLVLESSVLGLELVFEHRLYLPSMLPAAAAAAVMYRWSRGRVVLFGGVAAAVVLILSIWTWQRNALWGDPVAFWRDAAEKSPASARAHNNLGVALRQEGRTAEAIAAATRALRLKPDFVNAHVNLGNSYAGLGDYQRAVLMFRRAVSLKPDYAAVYVNLGNALLRLEETSRAAAAFRTALALDPQEARAMVNLGSIYAATGREREAVDCFQRASEAMPGNADIYFNLGLVYRRLGDEAQARRAWREAARLAPDDSAVRRLLQEIPGQ